MRSSVAEAYSQFWTASQKFVKYCISATSNNANRLGLHAEILQQFSYICLFVFDLPKKLSTVWLPMFRLLQSIGVLRVPTRYRNRGSLVHTKRELCLFFNWVAVHLPLLSVHHTYSRNVFVSYRCGLHINIYITFVHRMDKSTVNEYSVCLFYTV